MKTIGVLGGLGPQATMDFERRVHQISQQLIPPQGNSGYPPMVVHYCRHPPVLLEPSGLPVRPLQPDPRLLVAARALGQLADFLVITSNGVHALQSTLEQAADRPVLSMIEATLAEIARREWRRVGVLAYIGPHVYAHPLEQRGLEWEGIGAELQLPLDRAIMWVMEGRADAGAIEAARQAVAALRAQAVDGIILGCTEIPLLLEADLDAPDLLNPTALLAEAAVRHAIA
ncbi:MAG TPA: aspartate/glutamate racemase family protein [Roseiflexaceae bacterium]|nr:aspartate/glutamate racemase family protein [Roseiflexaceae bacterium]